MTELPLIIVDVQRGGPSTGLPTKTEQADLLQAMFGRNGESPACDRRPAVARRLLRHGLRSRAHRHAVHVPGLLLIGRLPRQRLGAVEDSRCRVKLPKIKVENATEPNSEGWNGAVHENGEATAGKFLPYRRDELLARPWAVPGTPGLEHRIGGIEKQDVTGNVNYEPANHEHMVEHAGEEDREHRH